MTTKRLGLGAVLLGLVAGCGGTVDGESTIGSESSALVEKGGVCTTPQNIREIGARTTPPIPVAGTPLGSGALNLPEIPKEARPAEGPGGGPETAALTASPQVQRAATHRSMSRHYRRFHKVQPPPLAAPIVRSTPVLGANGSLGTSFQGLTMRDQRIANGGNQFSVEPPDQGLCAGNGFVLESTNDVLRIFDTSGAPLTGVVDLNTFYGYAAQIDRTTNLQGPFVTDPSCYFDPDLKRWFHVVLTLDVDPATGDFLGSNHIDVAVSTTADPRGSWIIRQLPVQDDGTDGTPNHGCSLGPCIGDFPHIGADKNAFFVTTNEYSLNGPEFKSAQVYVFSKAALASSAATVKVVQFDTVAAVAGKEPGFTVWPAISASRRSQGDARGVEFFLSSNAAEEASGVAGGTFSNQIVLWAASNTKSIDAAAPCISLDSKVLRSEVYGIPPTSDQKAGSVPLADCLNADCLALGAPTTPEVEGRLDSSDSRMMQVSLSGDRLWGALDTVVNVGGEERAGVAFFAVDPEIEGHGHVEGRLVAQGYVAVAGNNVTYPALAVPGETGVMAMTLVGRDHYPTAAYASIGEHGIAAVRVAAEGVGPQDGFSEYKAFGDPPRPRWGDYGAAASDGKTIWIASEYIAQTCTFAEFSADPSCGGTRVTLGNWATRISSVKTW